MTEQGLKDLLESGHKVTAFARTLSKISIQHNNLKIIKGELMQVDTIDEPIKGADRLISIPGPKKNSRELVISKGTIRKRL